MVTNNTDILSGATSWLRPGTLAEMSASVWWQMARIWQCASLHALSSITEIFFKNHRTQNTQHWKLGDRRLKLRKSKSEAATMTEPELQSSDSHFIVRFPLSTILTLHNSEVYFANPLLKITKSKRMGEWVVEVVTWTQNLITKELHVTEISLVHVYTAGPQITPLCSMSFQ